MANISLQQQINNLPTMKSVKGSDTSPVKIDRPCSHLHHHSYHRSFQASYNSNSIDSSSALTPSTSKSTAKIIIRPLASTIASSNHHDVYSINNFKVISSNKSINNNERNNNNTNLNQRIKTEFNESIQELKVPVKLESETIKQVQVTNWSKNSNLLNQIKNSENGIFTSGGDGNLVIFTTPSLSSTSKKHNSALPPAIKLIQAEKKLLSKDNEVKPILVWQKKVSPSTSNSASIVTVDSISSPSSKRIKLEQSLDTPKTKTSYLDAEEIEVSLNPKLMFFSSNPSNCEHSQSAFTAQQQQAKSNENTGMPSQISKVTNGSTASSGFLRIGNRFNSYHNDTLPEKIFDTDDDDDDDDDDYYLDRGNVSHHHSAAQPNQSAESIIRSSDFQKMMTKNSQPDIDASSQKPDSFKTFNDQLEQESTTVTALQSDTSVAEPQSKTSEQMKIAINSKPICNVRLSNVTTASQQTKPQTIHLSDCVKIKNNQLINLTGRILACNNNNLKLTTTNTPTVGSNSIQLAAMTKSDQQASAPNLSIIPANFCRTANGSTTAKLLDIDKYAKIVQVKSLNNTAISATTKPLKTKKVKLITGSNGGIIATVYPLPASRNKKSSSKIPSTKNVACPNRKQQIDSCQKRRKEIWSQLLTEISGRQDRMMKLREERLMFRQSLARQCQQRTLDNQSPNLNITLGSKIKTKSRRTASGIKSSDQINTIQSLSYHDSIASIATTAIVKPNVENAITSTLHASFLDNITFNI